MTTGFEKVPTEKLKFILGVGEAGLTVWKGKHHKGKHHLAEIRIKLEAMRKELAKRGVNPREFGFNEDPDATHRSA